jgi:cyclopropane fatty-acyl-phospholipid synthase-like methyltransferase
MIDLSGASVLLDIGGGSGAHAIGAVQRWPRLLAIVFDLPPVCQVAEGYVARYGLQECIKTHAGDMWSDPFPAADVHFYADIFHDWPEEKCRLLAQKSFDSLESGGRIVLHELLYRDDKAGPYPAAAYSGAMLLWTEGRQRSGRELWAMLADAGFRDVTIQPTTGYWSVVTAEKR